MQSVKFRKRLKYAKTHIIFIIVNFVNIIPIICILFVHNIVINKDKHFFQVHFFNYITGNPQNETEYKCKRLLI